MIRRGATFGPALPDGAPVSYAYGVNRVAEQEFHVSPGEQRITACVRLDVRGISNSALRAVHVDSGVGEIGRGIDRHAR
jgi:hypothetical protein